MRTLDGRLLADLNDNVPALLTGSVDSIVTSSIDENTTNYALLPERINAVPFISTSIYNSSTPQIKPIQFNDPGKQNLFIDAQGVVKVAVGTNFTFRLKAQQPPIYNIENGVPTVYSDQTKLVYLWQKDGADIIRSEDLLRPSSSVKVQGTYGEELTFTNTSPKFAGTYVCIVSNDIGSTESEQITLEVYNPDIEDSFYKNIITNPYGKDGTDGWSSPDQELIVDRLSNTEFKNFSQPWNIDLFGYSKDMLYPRPYHINTYHIRNSNFTQDLLQEGYYFTRERFKYKAKDGKAIINAAYDVDLASVQEYIQGSIYGIDGVRAVFGCYIGNAISKFRVSLLNALITKRSSKFALLPSKPRLDIINVLLAGVPLISEQIKVTITEYDNETPLISTINGLSYPGYTMYDPWTNALRSSSGSYNIAANVQGAVNVPSSGNEVKIVNAIQTNLLFPSIDFVPTYGQYAEFNRLVIDKLNFRTNKIRINLCFEAFHDVLSIVSKEHVDNSDECFEYVPWDWIQLPLHWPSTTTDFAKDPATGNFISVDWYNQSVLNIPKEEPFRYATQLGQPRAMTTGFNLVLFPLEPISVNKADYYTKTVLTPIDAVQDYPPLETGTTISSELGAYLGSISDYDYEIVGVNISNRYNLPFSTPNYTEYTKAQGGVASRTTISTYKYNKNHTEQFPEPLNFTSSIWQPFVLSTNQDFQIGQSSTADYVVFYNSSSGDLSGVTLPQVIGNIESNVIKYTNNLVTDVPLTFSTASIVKYQYLKRMGFTLNLYGEDYGIPTTESLNSLTLVDRKNLLLEDWRTLKDTAGNVSYYYRLLEKIDQPNNSTSGFIPNMRSSQHIIYNDIFAATWGTSATNQQYNLADSKLNLSDSFTFTSESIYEGRRLYSGSSSTQNAGQFYEIRAKQNADLKYVVDGQFTWVVNVNGVERDLRTKIQQGYTSTYPTTAQTGAGVSTGTGIDYIILAAGKSLDRVKLQSVVIDGSANTPSVIVIPSKRKIYYFIYKYTDNVLNEY